MKKLKGEAPCTKCNLYIQNIKLTGYKDSCICGGYHYKCEPGQFCIDCGNPFIWLHVPSREDLTLNIKENILEIYRDTLSFSVDVKGLRNG